MKFVALLRGINVSGQKKILMAYLRTLIEKSDKIHYVKTYIQSGNIIFDSDIRDTNELSAIISTLIYNEYRFEVAVQVYNLAKWTTIINSNPFLKDSTIAINRLYVTLLDRIPSERNISTLKMLDFNQDQYVIIGNVIFLNYYNGAGRSKMSNNIFEKKLYLSATSRNWKTVCKIHELLSS